MPYFASILSVVLSLLAQAPSPSAPPAAVAPTGQAEARQAVQGGKLVPLAQVATDALRRYPGTLVEAELEDGKYEIEILGEDGVVMELEYDARTGRLLKMEVEDDG